MAKGIGGRRERRVRTGLVVLGLLVAACAGSYVLVQLKRGQDVDISSLLGLVLAALSLLGTFAGLRRAALGDAAARAKSAADTLAREIERVETKQWQALVGGERTRINLRYTVHASDDKGDPLPVVEGRLFDEGTAGMPHIAALFRDRKSTRMVITGAPGAGKTVLALELLLALIEHRIDTEAVPVRVPLAEWDTDTELESFLAAHLVRVHDCPRDWAKQLVEHGYVLPVLDGLDEMDPGLTDEHGNPLTDTDGRQLPDPAAPRARAALNVLNNYGVGRDLGSLVLTCRTAHYDAMRATDHLKGAVRVHIQPVPTIPDASTAVRADDTDAVTYLARRSGPCGQRARWQPLLHHLRTQPTGVLARSLSTPWRLSLAATVYQNDGDPTELLKHNTGEDLDAHLLARLIPTAARLASPPLKYDPVTTHKRLALLARHIQPRFGTSSGPRVNLTLHGLWPVGGRYRVPAVDSVMTALLVLAPLPAAWTAPERVLNMTAVIGFAAIGAILAAGMEVHEPYRLNWQYIRSRKGFRYVLQPLLIGLAVGAPVSALFAVLLWATERIDEPVTVTIPMSGPNGEPLAVMPIEDPQTPTNPVPPGQWLSIGLFIGLLFTVLIAVLLWVAMRPPSLVSSTPSGAVRTSLAHGAWLTIVAACLTTPMIGAAGGISLALTLGLSTSGAAARRYCALLLCTRGKLPIMLGTFLHWCYNAGLLRMSGGAFQFRHRELEQWLATHPTP